MISERLISVLHAIKKELQIMWDGDGKRQVRL